MLSSTYQTTHGPLLSTLYEPLPKHLISVLGGQAMRLGSGGEMSDDLLCDERLALGIWIAVSSKEERLPCGCPLPKDGREV